MKLPAKMHTNMKTTIVKTRYLHCRLANHQLSTRRVRIEDYNTHFDNIGIADQYILIVKYYNCKSEWIEHGEHLGGFPK